VIEAIEGVAAIHADGDRVILEYLSTRDDAAALLAKLIEIKLPVSSFAPNAAGLEEAYLRSDVAQVD